MQKISNLPIIFGILALAVGVLACGREARKELVLYPTEVPSPSQTPLAVQVTATPQVIIVEITNTPPNARWCVSAPLAVYLRPSPNDQNYPIMVIPHGTEVEDLGGRDGQWLFVGLEDRQGWVHGGFLRACS